MFCLEDAGAEDMTCDPAQREREREGAGLGKEGERARKRARERDKTKRGCNIRDREGRE